MLERNCETKITDDLRIMFKHFVWSIPFLAPFETRKQADEWRKKEWPEATHH